MKRTFLPKRSVLQQLLTLSWGGGALVLVLVLALVRFVSPTTFYTVTAPLSFAGTSIAAMQQSLFGGFSNAAVLASENEQLSRDLDALRIQNLALEARVHTLTTLVQPEQRQASVPGLLAQVVARPPVSGYDTLTLAPGSDRGVMPYMEVFGIGGSPVGVVSEVMPGFARAVLFSAPLMRTSAWVGAAQVPITLVGRGGGAVEATVARIAPVAVGDIVYVPGPGMLPYGTVARIDGDTTAPSVTLSIQSFNNPFTLGEVQLRATGMGPEVFTATTTTP